MLPILFTPLNERSASLSSDKKTVLFTVRLGDGYRQAICISTLDNGHWSEPVVASFSGFAFDADPFFTRDGKTVLFSSNRAADGSEKADLDIWSVTRNAGGSWGEPHPIEGPINSSANESSPVLTASGRLYFSSSRTGNGDIYVAEPTKDGFSTPRPLDEINSPASEVGVAVSPDEHTLVFAALGRDDETFAPGHLYTRGDLYVSYWSDGHWTAPSKLPPPINTAATEAGASFSPDGKHLYFMSERGFATDQSVRLTASTLRDGLATALNGRGNIYSISVNALRPPQ